MSNRDDLVIITLTTEERDCLVGDLERAAIYLANIDNQDAQGMASDCNTVIRVLLGEGIEE